ncbi:MAG TPA: M28 family peptidase [Brevundimonas sp.]|jgi:Zn-dependent M28 family amino/carboxypeptidase|uniref:M28 family peptidase n=1 Tax=Brevundimonas sp. TaxID=1871086 RepID=UPI002DE3D2CE|nr:M28 family peptidase [Brevundimonas sp.]
MTSRLLAGVAALSLLVAGACATAPASAPEPEISAQRLSDGIRTISADAYQGRYPGTEGERMTLAWLQAQYEAMGLQPGGPNGQWLQRVELKRYTPEGAASVSWTGPDGATHVLEPGKDILVRAATNDGRADVRGAGVVFAGFGIDAPERNWNDYGSLDVRGKVVIVMAGEPDGEVFNGQYTTHHASTSAKADQAFRRGAVGLIMLNPVAATDSAWTGAARRNNAQRTYTPGAADLEFTGSINMDTAHAMAMAAGMDHASFANYASGGFRAVELPGVKLNVQTAETINTLVTHNLLAKIEGTERPDEVIVYSAHWDHVGGAAQHPDAAGEDKIWNGAWDNASGTVGVVEMARAFAAGPRPERTVVFAHMAAEEMGLMGAYAYAADPVYPLEKTVADINIDMLPLSPPTRDVAIFGKGQNDLEDRLSVLAAAEGRYITDDRQPEQGFYYRSDHFPFARAGVPALMPWHGVDWDEGGVPVGRAAWDAKFEADYHQPSDEWSPNLDFRSAVENLELLYRLGFDLANSRDWPGWKPTSEFGAVRARTDAARQ